MDATMQAASEPHLHAEILNLRSELGRVEAMLCAVCTAAESSFEVQRDYGGKVFTTILSGIDWKKAGVTAGDVQTWWEKHKAADAARLEREREAAKRIALAKLTDEEKELLGLVVCDTVAI